MRRRVIGTVLEIVTPVAAVAAIWIWTVNADSFFFPPLPDVLEAFKDAWLFADVRSQLVPSLTRMLTGWALAMVVGIGLGVVIGLSPVTRRVTAPVIEFLRALPAATLLPLVVLAFGFRDSGKVFLIAFTATPFVLLNVADGVRGIDPLFRDTCRVYGIGRWRALRSVVLPAALGRIFAGARLAMVVALVAMVLSEYVASKNGVGYVILDNQQSFAVPQMWAGILLLGLLGYGFTLLFTVVERRVMSWHQGMSSGA